MTDIDTAKIIAAIRSGQTVSEVAESVGLTCGAVYLRLRQAGVSATELAASAQPGRNVTVHPCPSYDGYRVLSDGRIQSCWSRGQPSTQTEYWRDLTISQQANARSIKPHLYVTLGSSSGGGRSRPSIRTVYIDALGQERGEALWERMLSRVK